MAMVGPEGSIKNTNIPIGNLTRDLPACDAVLRYRYMAYRVRYAMALWPVACGEAFWCSGHRQNWIEGLETVEENLNFSV